MQTTQTVPVEVPTPTPSPTMIGALRTHWPEYLSEAAALGMFMISACIFGVLLDHPMSIANQTIENPLLRRGIGGLAMGLTAICIITSPWGKRSGAHMNPSVTLSFLLLRKVAPWDAVFYILFQFLGGIAGVGLASLLIGVPLSHAAVDYVVTVPGSQGATAAFLAEIAISALMMWTILCVSNSRLARFTPLFAGALVATYITCEAPLSGMSMNPARTFGSAVIAGEWTALWVYFTAPLLGMLSAASLYRWRHGVHRVFCAKLHHDNCQRCIFRCNYGALATGETK
jgi:aquaporin Z